MSCNKCVLKQACLIAKNKPRRIARWWFANKEEWFYSGDKKVLESSKGREMWINIKTVQDFYNAMKYMNDMCMRFKRNKAPVRVINAISVEDLLRRILGA